MRTTETLFRKVRVKPATDLEMSNGNSTRTPSHDSQLSPYCGFSELANEYREYVQRLAGQWPGLSYLDAYLQDPLYLQRQTFGIVLVKPSNVPPVQRDLKLEELLPELDDGSSPILIVLEDPTPRMIAELGGQLRIDPQFWADFLVGPSWFGSGKVDIGPGEPSVQYRDDSLLEQLWPLPRPARQQEHFCFRFVAHREPTPASFQNSVGPNMDGHSSLSPFFPNCGDVKPGPPICANSIGLRNNLAVWENQHARKRANGETETSSRDIPWIGVIVAKNQSSRIPVCEPGFSYVFREFLPRPRFVERFVMDNLESSKEWEGRPQRAPKSNFSVKEILWYHLICHLENNDFRNAALTSPSLLFVDVLQLIGCFWVAEIESKHLQLSWMEVYYQKEVITRRRKFPSLMDPLYPDPNGSLSARLQADLIGLHSDLIKIEPYEHFIHEAEEYCKAREQLTGLPDYSELANDFAYLQKAVCRLNKRVKRIMGFLKSIEDDFEKSRSRYRNMLLLILALWAWLVSPVSVTASIMNLGESRESSAIKVGDVQVFWKVVVPLGVGVVLIVVSLLWITEFFTLKATRKASRSRTYR
ncbi:hypothetical protein AtubIFM54640_005273 [Aspergillus tubingensis]|nr:hypothetical protein AtubIFM54640_005273 [Aspergillus tubingensis]